MIGNIQVGDSAEKIIRLYGTPNHDDELKGIRAMMYEDSYEQWNEVLFYSAVFEFIENKLVCISIYNGE